MNAQTKHTPTFTVNRQKDSGSRCFGVYRDGELVEGGFFDRGNAEECRRIWIEESSAAIAKATGDVTP